MNLWEGWASERCKLASGLLDLFRLPLQQLFRPPVVASDIPKYVSQPHFHLCRRRCMFELRCVSSSLLFIFIFPNCCSLIGKLCYEFLKDPSVAHQKNADLRVKIFDLLGVLIKDYSHELTCVFNMVQVRQFTRGLLEKFCSLTHGQWLLG